MGKGVILTSIVGPLVALVCIVYIARQMTVKAWQDFLDSLSTVGGNVFVLLILFCIMLSALIHVLVNGKQENPEVVTVIISVFSGVSTALMVVLKGNSSKQQMADRIAPLIPLPPKPEDVPATNTATTTTVTESNTQGGTTNGVT